MQMKEAIKEENTHWKCVRCKKEKDEGLDSEQEVRLLSA